MVPISGALQVHLPSSSPGLVRLQLRDGAAGPGGRGGLPAGLLSRQKTSVLGRQVRAHGGHSQHPRPAEGERSAPAQGQPSGQQLYPVPTAGVLEAVARQGPALPSFSQTLSLCPRASPCLHPSWCPSPSDSGPGGRWLGGRPWRLFSESSQVTALSQCVLRVDTGERQKVGHAGFLEAAEPKVRR